jgi:hypothetical protein
MSRQAACGDRGEVAGRKVLQKWKIRDLGIAAKSAQLVWYAPMAITGSSMMHKTERLLQEVKISSLSVCEAAQGLLFLWKPIVCTPPKDIPQICTPVSSASSERKVKRKSRGGQKSIPPPVPGAIPLCDLPYELASGKTQTPSYIYFPPNYTEVPVGSFKDILVRTVEYCDRLGKIPQGGVGRIVVPSGTSPGNPARYSRVGSWFVCTHGSARQMVEYAIRVLKACGIDPCTVFISYQASPSLGTPTR